MTPKGYPRKIQGIDLGANLDLLWASVDAKQRQPNDGKREFCNKVSQMEFYCPK